MGYLCETNRATQYSPRRIQQIIKETAEQAEITKRGMPIEQMQKFLGHSTLETTQLYAESSTEMLRESSQKALAR